MLTNWPAGTVTILVTGGSAPHAIPVSAAIRAAPSVALLGLARSRESLRRLRADPACALVVLAAGDVAFTAHGRATVLDVDAGGVVAVRVDVDDVQDHGQPTFVVEDGVRWRWTDEAAAERDREVRSALRALADTLPPP